MSDTRHGPPEPTVVSSPDAPEPDRDGETVIADNPPVRDNQKRADLARTVIAVPVAATPPKAPKSRAGVSLGVLMRAGASPQGIGPGPVIAAATPLLMLLGRLQRGAYRFRASDLRGHITAAMEDFGRSMANAGVSEEDARMATYALCETVDDIVGNLPDSDASAWIQDGMLLRFFDTQTVGVGFFEAVNKLLADPFLHHDLLQLMHACLSLGFRGQYRGREEAGLDRVRSDVYDTLCYVGPDSGDGKKSSGRQGRLAAAAENSEWKLFWFFAAGACAVLAGIYLTLLLLLDNQADAVAGKLRALSSPTGVVIERTAAQP